MISQTHVDWKRALQLTRLTNRVNVMSKSNLSGLKIFGGYKKYTPV